MNTPSAPQTLPGSVSAGILKPVPGDAKCEERQDKEWEPEFRESFSKGILRLRLQEFNGGKYTRRYIETYLEFMHLSGMISNLDYLDFKNNLPKE